MNNLNITKEDLNEMKCIKCETSIFTMFFKIAKISALKSPNGKEMFVEVPVYACANCGEILDKDLK